MDSILASIRRIILEDEAGPQPSQSQPAQDMESDDDLLVLSPAMMVDRRQTESRKMAMPALNAEAQSAADLAACLFDNDPPSAPEPAPNFSTAVPPATNHFAAPDSLLAPETSQAASRALSNLQQVVRPEPDLPSSPMLLRSGGPTIEDLVRDELRGHLKQWLDAHLPSMVERLVQTEIARLVRPA